MPSPAFLCVGAAESLLRVTTPIRAPGHCRCLRLREAMTDIVKVLVVDDSAYVRKVVRQMLSRSPFLEVVGTARDGREALELVEELRPDVITCDLQHAGDGRGVVRSGADGAAAHRRSSSSAWPTQPVRRCWRRSTPARSTSCRSRRRSPASGSSTWPTSSSKRSRLPRPARRCASLSDADAPVTVLQTVRPRRQPRWISWSSASRPAGHRRSKSSCRSCRATFPCRWRSCCTCRLGYTELYAGKLDEVTPLNVKEAAEGDDVAAGMVLLAPAGRHLTFRRSADASSPSRPAAARHAPSARGRRAVPVGRRIYGSGRWASS